MPVLRRLSRTSLLLLASVPLVVAVLGGAYLLLAPQTLAAPPQPIDFPHSVMVQEGITCVFCHTDAYKSPSPGMPSVDKCMGCHKTIGTQTPRVKQLAQYWQDQKPIPWNHVVQLPRFVHFPHLVHVTAAGLNCERCHGDVGHMTVAQQVVQMNMGWCLGCHESQPNAEQLRDCVLCHQ